MRREVTIFQDNTVDHRRTVSVTIAYPEEGKYHNYHNISHSALQLITWLCERQGKLVEFYIGATHSYIRFDFTKGQ